MALSGKTIIISSTNANSVTPLRINGKGRDLPHGVEIAVSDAELAALQDSNVILEVTGDAKASDLKQAADATGEDAAPTSALNTTTQVAGADFLPKVEPIPAVAIPLVPAENPTPAGADNLSSEPLLAEPGEAREKALDLRSQAEDGTIEPVVVLNNAAANPADAPTAQGGEFNAESALDRSIPDITEDLDEYDQAQLRALIDAEKAGKNRSTLIGALESKLEA